MNGFIANPPKPFPSGRRPPAPKGRPAIGEPRGEGCPGSRGQAWLGFPGTSQHAPPPNAQFPTTVTHHRRVARLGLAIGNLESEWDFLPATLALALTPGYFALRICAVDLKNALETAEALDKIKQCLEASQISVEVENIRHQGQTAARRVNINAPGPICRRATPPEGVQNDPTTVQQPSRSLQTTF